MTETEELTVRILREIRDHRLRDDVDALATPVDALEKGR